MALKFLSAHAGGSHGSSAVKFFDIRLENDYIVFRGGEDEAGSAQLAGELALCVTEPLTVCGINLTLSGIVHMSYQTNSTASMSGRRIAFKEKKFYEKTWTFKDAGKGKTEILPPNNYLWPFDVVLDGTLPESVEGLKEAYIVYRLKAEITRKRAKDIVVRKPLRIVRTLGPSALELSHAMSVENIWPNKVEYSISTPSKAVVFGSFLRVDFKLIPLLKGLAIGNISTQLKEEQEFVLDPEWQISALNGGCTREDRIIAWDNYKLNEGHEMEIIDEAAEGYQVSRYLELPKSLTKCLQDCNVKGIKIRHKIKFNVQLHNPDGHISELRANLPVSLYISENLPLDANNDLIDQTPQAGRAAVENDLSHSAPPLYGEHQLDQLYMDVDPSGYRTPGGMLSTNGTPYTHSRNISTENLATIEGPTASAGSPGHVSAAALQNRLTDLRASERIIPTSARHHHDDELQPVTGDLSRRGSQNANGDYFSGPGSMEHGSYPRHSPHGVNSGHSSQGGSNDISRQNSAENERNTSGPVTPLFFTGHMEDLAKVPSYSTAVRTPAPRTAPVAADLPSYRATISASEPSPAPLMEPPTAHVRGPPGHHHYLHSDERGASLQQSSGRQNSLQDDERRLRMLQLRERG